MGGTREEGNHIDEFVTDVLRNKLLGLPLTCSVQHCPWSQRRTPVAELARRQLLDATGETALTPYESWVDFSST